MAESAYSHERERFTAAVEEQVLLRCVLRT